MSNFISNICSKFFLLALSSRTTRDRVSFCVYSRKRNIKEYYNFLNFSSNASHPGYEINYAYICVVISIYIIYIFATTLIFVLFTIFIKYQMDVCIYLASMIGDNTSHYRNQDTKLLTKLVILFRNNFVYMILMLFFHI